MKKKITGKGKTYFGVKLYRKDVDEILAILAPLFEDLEISDNDSIYDSINEIETHKGQIIRELNFLNASPSFSLAISRGKTTITRGGETETYAAYQQIKAILDANKNFLHKFGLIYFGLLILLMIVVQIMKNELTIPIANALFVGAWALAIVSVIVFILIPQSKIILVNKHEEQSFWRIKKFDLVSDGIKIIIGFALGLLAAFLIYYFKLN